jgi:hypothetical protein
MGEGQRRLLDQVQDRIRRKHYSMRAAEVEAFLMHVAVAKRVSAPMSRGCRLL